MTERPEPPGPHRIEKGAGGRVKWPPSGRRSLAKELYDATATLRRIAIDAQNDVYGDQRASREAIKKLTDEASSLAAWLYR